jgi:hypothetical protein
LRAPAGVLVEGFARSFDRPPEESMEGMMAMLKRL